MSEAAPARREPVDPPLRPDRPFNTAKPAIEPALLSAEDAARLSGVGKSTWWTYHTSGLCPTPVRLGGRTLWRAAELRDWIAAGCPPRVKWQAMNGGMP